MAYMESSTEKCDLADLAMNYKVVLFDASAIIQPFVMKTRGLTTNFDHEKKMLEYNGRKNLYTYIGALLHQGRPIYITSKISKELGEELPFNPNRILKKRKKISDKKFIRRIRALKEDVQIKDEILSLFEEKGRILELSRREQDSYRGFEINYSHLIKRYGLSDADFDFLISGASVASKRGKTALVSNDGGISDAWAEIMKRSSLPSGSLDFFVSNTFKEFIYLSLPSYYS
ncbi:MAG: hypothetical protein ABIE22_02855 [archaeon]